jgi:hypothetical protein
MHQPHRIVPRVGPENYKTYLLRRPLATHWRPATCSEVDCKHYLLGWQTMLASNDPQVDLVRSLRGQWHFTEAAPEGGVIVFTFPAGQKCFRTDQHRLPMLDRPALYVVRGGDWRGDPRGETPRVHNKPEHWVEDMQEHLDRVRTDRAG